MWKPFARLMIVVYGRFDWIIHVDPTLGIRTYLVKHIIMKSKVGSPVSTLAKEALVLGRLAAGFPLEFPDFAKAAPAATGTTSDYSVEPTALPAFIKFGPCVYQLSDWIVDDKAQKPGADGDVEYAESDYEHSFNAMQASKFASPNLLPVSFLDTANTVANEKTLTDYGPGGFVVENAPVELLLALGSKAPLLPMGDCAVGRSMPLALRLRFGSDEQQFSGSGLLAPYVASDVTDEYKWLNPPIFQIDRPAIKPPGYLQGFAQQVDIGTGPGQSCICVRFGTVVAPKLATLPTGQSGYLLPWRPAIATVDVEGFF